ncbi:ATP-binding protein, partial [Nodularia sp. UHCC 0506]|uniref:ATP-binding protein n=1 Tax=Nodularia sp. UHCC 0506 TaxID=3110243 RepID=UPI002B20F120
MQIQQISVDGLFGIFNHVIPLNLDERITIIHGPNGFGKTVMLRMLNGFFNSRYSVFRTIPFVKFRVEFDNGSRVEVVKTSETLEENKKREHITFDFYQPGLPKNSFSLSKTKNPPALDFPIDMLDDIIPEIRRIGSKIWQYLPTGETLSLNEVIDRFDEILPPSKAKYN